MEDPGPRPLTTRSIVSGGEVLGDRELEARWANAWRPEEIARRLAGVSVPWYVAAGWALDLFRGEQTRPHGDLEIAVPVAGFTEVRERFPGHAFDVPSSGRVWFDAGADVLAATHQTWLREPVTGHYLCDVFREPHDGDTWICRRDEGIRLPYEVIVERTADRIPYLVPELVLLFKAKEVRPKDQLDFENVLPLLGPQRRRTLRELLERVHPAHAWLGALS
ncbi:nucleotidyltransferase domain-containing protein [Lentzea sp. HUAS TT2]|uniref:nucleotidyltransferase domain-containing protein n=1 Tax=Lentzea sp. HUAS TT2 TaxID=3447454 RepID=UPI003F719749